MKKINEFAPPIRWQLKKMFKIMKLSLVLTLSCVIQVSASVYSQNAKFNLKLQNVTIEKVFSQIKSQSDFTFFYDDASVEEIKTVSIDVKNASVGQLPKRNCFFL